MAQIQEVTLSGWSKRKKILINVIIQKYQIMCFGICNIEQHFLEKNMVLYWTHEIQKTLRE